MEGSSKPGGDEGCTVERGTRQHSVRKLEMMACTSDGLGMTRRAGLTWCGDGLVLHLGDTSLS